MEHKEILELAETLQQKDITKTEPKIYSDTNGVMAIITENSRIVNTLTDFKEEPELKKQVEGLNWDRSVKINPDYFKKILKVLGKHDRSVTIRISDNYPICFEFVENGAVTKIIVAPMVTEE